MDNQRDFTPLVASVDGLLQQEFASALKVIAAKLTVKWGRPHSVVCNYVRTIMSIAIAHATNRCFRGARVPASQIGNPLPQWSDGTSFGLFNFIRG